MDRCQNKLYVLKLCLQCNLLRKLRIFQVDMQIIKKRYDIQMCGMLCVRCFRNVLVAMTMTAFRSIMMSFQLRMQIAQSFMRQPRQSHGQHKSQNKNSCDNTLHHDPNYMGLETFCNRNTNFHL